MDDDDDGGGGGWLMSYADLMTLLFAAFVVLYGITPKGEGETDELRGVVSSIRESFLEIPDQTPDVPKEGPSNPGKSVLTEYKAKTVSPPIVKRYRRYEHILNVINHDMMRVKNALKIKKHLPTESKSAEKKEQPVTFIEDTGGFKVRILASYYYPKGEAKLPKNYLPILDAIGNELKSLDRDIIIEGHTQTSRESDVMSNLELSSMRAAYIAEYLVKELKFPKKRIGVAGYADTKPLTPDQSEESQKLNRRIEIRVKYD